MFPDRRIFGPYWDGRANVYADPIAVRRKLSACLGGDLPGVVRAMRSANPVESLPALERLCAAVCAAFGLGSPFDPATGAGVVEAEWRPVLEQFIAWLAAQKKTTASPPR